MDKYNRNYQLLVGKKDGTTLQVNLPFTVEFDIHRNSFSSANVAQIRIYNLSPDNRAQIRKDQFDTLDLRQISLKAGYGDQLSLAFQGNISQAWSVREGVNMITQIESFDGGFAYINAVTDTQFVKDIPQKSIITALVKNLPGGVTKGAIGNWDGKISRGNTYSGKTTDILAELTGKGFFVDNMKANALLPTECLVSDIPLINAQTGLLGTPVREQTYVQVEMLFEPSLKVGQLIQLESQELSGNFNGRYKVISIVHRGVISAAVCGSATSSIGLLPGTFTPVPEVAS